MSTLRQVLRGFTLTALCLVFTFHLSAQETRLAPHWWFGGALGVNYNMYGGNTQNLITGTSSSPAFSKGSGAGLFLAPLLEFRPDPVWGGMLALGFDSRRGSFDDVTSAGGVAQSLSATMNYLSLEPSLRISPFNSGFYFFVGPRLGFNVAKSFSYTKGGATTDAEFNSTRGTVVSGQVGAGWDINLSNPDANLQTQISPFLSFHAGQGPRSLDAPDDWSLSTIRAGIAIKFGTSSQLHEEISREIQFSFKAPKVVAGARRVRETFPLRNYVFFDEGSSDIPSRYERLSADDAKNFSEEHLLQPEPKDLTGRSRRQLTVYHNTINILGDRLRKNPDATVTLIGSNPDGIEKGRAQADEIKKYLVDVFGVSADRIRTEGRVRPEHPSSSPNGTRELDLVQAEDRRVDIVSADPAILKPVEIISLQEEPLQDDVVFNVGGAQDLLSSWDLELTDQNGKVQRFGPYTSEQERVSGKRILANEPQGTYKVVMIGESKSGQTIRKEETLRLAKSEAPEDSLGRRFSILFEFDESKTVSTYANFLTKTVAPLIPDGGSVIIHGHTDIVGEESHNLKLSQDRAKETQRILEGELAKEGKRHVSFDTYGFGEDPRRAPFDNKTPEERFYNRTVIIDISPEQ